MPKCNTVGCNKEATKHDIIDVGFGMCADVWSCDEHHKEHVELTVDCLEKD